MPLYILDDELWFPAVEDALPDGLVAAGGDLSCERLLLAYRSGIFPWYNEDEPILWWSPDPRFVLFPAELKISKSMKQVIKKHTFEFRTNTDFSGVVGNCRMIKRKDADGTWISDDIERAYNKLYDQGYGYSAEAWHQGRLAGGLYGIKLGKVFFGESMFSLEPNASKFAFINLVEQLQKEGIVLIDCQVYTTHLESLGARMIPREKFISLVAQYAG